MWLQLQNKSLSWSNKPKKYTQLVYDFIKVVSYNCYLAISKCKCSICSAVSFI